MLDIMNFILFGTAYFVLHFCICCIFVFEIYHFGWSKTNVYSLYFFPSGPFSVFIQFHHIRVLISPQLKTSGGTSPSFWSLYWCSPLVSGVLSYMLQLCRTPYSQLCHLTSGDQDPTDFPLLVRDVDFFLQEVTQIIDFLPCRNYCLSFPDILYILNYFFVYCV